MMSPTLAASWSAAGETVPILSKRTAGGAAVVGKSHSMAPRWGGHARVSVPLAVAMSATWPASMSAWVTV